MKVRLRDTKRGGRTAALVLAGLAAAALGGCGDRSEVAASATYGPNPQIPPPKEKSSPPTLNYARAVGWPAGASPRVAEGFQVTRMAEGLDHPRYIYVLPNGDVLVTESNTPPRKARDFQSWVNIQARRRAGAMVPSANRITLLRDADGDGRTELRTVFLSGLDSPYGVTLVGDQLFVANRGALMRYPYREGDTAIRAPGMKVADIPHNPPNNHWVRNVVASPDGTKLYVSVGSNSNFGEGGMDKEVERAAILEMRPDGTGRRVYASGLRNPVGMAWEPATGVLWTVVNERDMLGHDTPPDYMTGLKDGGFYGWPYSYHGRHPDPRVQPQRPDLVARALTPDYALGAHTASLGLAFYTAQAFPERYRGGAFVGQHGSWNREPRSGYKVVFVPFRDGRPAGPSQDILTGFLDERGRAQGRPVGVAVDRAGALLVADDVGNIVWRLTAKAAR